MTKAIYTLIIAASLVTLLPASQGLAQNGPSVTVVNPATNPAITSSVDDPGRIPYQFHTLQTCANSCFVTTPAVPQGKRLVVQHVSAFGGLLSNFIQVEVFTVVGGAVGDKLISAFAPPVFGTAPNLGYAFDQTVLGYADAGNTVGITLLGSFGNDVANFILTGYLLDCTVNQCAPVSP